MAENIDIKVIIDENCTKPVVTIRTKEKDAQVDQIINAIEDAAQSRFDNIPAYFNGKIELIPQNEIMRIRTEGRQIVLDTETRYYIIRQTLSQLEEELSSRYFIRISQSEIINIFKVKEFDVSVSGTIGIEFENGVKTYASRRYIKSIRQFLNNREGK